MKHRNWDTAMAMHQILMSRINGKNNNLVLCLHASVLNKYYIKKKNTLLATHVILKVERTK